MFPYFGCKSRLAHLYPPPAQGRIIEPFAGSARYSLLHWDRDVWISDIDPLIYRIWRYLQQATRKDIESLPELKAGEDLRDFKLLSEVERELLGFAVGFPALRPAYTCSAAGEQDHRCRRLKARILEHLPHIRHWKVTCLHYCDLPGIEATWFVDAPYQHASMRYRYDCVLDYNRLARWCRSRRGRVIVCEGRGASWLPFRPFAQQITSEDSRFEEMVWAKQ
jgi:hypothetical protein